MLKFFLCIILSKSSQNIYALFLLLSIITFENDDNVLILYLNKRTLSAKVARPHRLYYTGYFTHFILHNYSIIIRLCINNESSNKVNHPGPWIGPLVIWFARLECYNWTNTTQINIQILFSI